MKNKLLQAMLLTMLMSLTVATSTAAKKAVFLYAGQSNADGREYVQNLPDYMKVGSSPYSPYTHLRWASICGNPTASTFGTRTMATGERYAFCDVTNYWIDQAANQDFYAIKCAYGGTAIAPGVTAEKLPIWYADAEWMTMHFAYDGSDITQAANANKNSLTKNLTEGFASLVDGTLAAIEGGYDVKAIMWHQGESDRNAAGSYYTNFKTMIAYMRQAIYTKTGDEADLTLPFIFGTVCRNSTQYSVGVEQAQRQVAEEDANVYLIDMSNATLLSDNLHFDKQATEYLGKKIYNKLVELNLVAGSQVEVDEFPVVVSPMDAATHYDNYTWNILPVSDATATKLQDHVDNNSMYNKHDTYGYRRSSNIYEEQLLYSDGTSVAETAGLYFIAGVNRVAVNTTHGLWFVNGEPTFFLPKMKAGQIIKVTAKRSSSNTAALVPASGYDNYLELLSASNEMTTTSQEIVYRVRYNFTGEKHIGFAFSGSAHTQVSKIEISTPESSYLLIGADQKELYSSSKTLDFSPFTDLFKAYVVTGYDDTTGKVDCEQVLQVPANTGVLLVGDECEVQIPVKFDGSTPAAPAVNLLTAVVGEGNAPVNSFVLTTSAGVTQFTKTATAVAMENQAYLTLDGATLNAYNENLYDAKTEHVYDIIGGSILSKGTKLTFGNEKHHTVSDGSKSVDVYSPGNASGLEGRFVFDNSGNWGMDDSNYRLGANSSKTLYCSVVSLENGDRVKLEWGANDASLVHVYDLAGILRGVSAGGEITNGETYVVENNTGEPINLDLKMYCGSNRAGFTKMTVWSSTETTALVQHPAPTASVVLQQVREGLYKPVVTLSVTNDQGTDITYYYKGGDASDWTSLAGTTFEPTQKAAYQFKAATTGMIDSEALTLNVGHRYRRATTIDLTTDEAYTASTKSNDGYTWDGWGLDASQVYGKISSASFCGLTVTNNNNDARYSFAKNIGFANNHGGRVITATGLVTYNIVGYECYQNKSLTDLVESHVLYNGSNANFNLPIVNSGGALKRVYIYEPIEVASVIIAEGIGYATFCSEEALDFTGSGLQAYYATADGDNVKFDNDIINPAAETGLLLKGEAGNYEVLVAESGTNVSSTNLLKPCLEAKTVGTDGCEYGKVFILSKHNDKVGFFKSNNGRTLQAGKSYLYIDNPTEARQLAGFPFYDETNGIVHTRKEILTIDDKVYTLHGQRVKTPSVGLYIVGGKKIMMK